jgi:acetyltransferase AlgX (SGNH hydrolase-like protein)
MATRWLLAVVATALWGYLMSVLFQGSRIIGISVTPAVVYGLVVVGGATFSVLAARLSESRRRDFLASCLSLLMGFLAIDTAYSAWTNLQKNRRASQIDERLDDSHVWVGELVPRSYYPSDAAFTLYKPNVRVEGTVYGEFYETRMLKSPTLVRDALRLRRLVYTIDANGFRNRVDISQSKVWALGDSYAMGYSTTEGLTWSDRLGALTGQPIYNLGVSGTGPGVQVQMLEYLLRNRKDHAKPDRLLWMVFEGNDLENSYAGRRALSPATSGVRALFDGTLVGDLISLPSTIRSRSVIGRLLEGDLQFRRSRAGRRDSYQVDGVSLVTPAYRSDRFGYCMFNPLHVDVATKGEDYVLSHPNRPHLDESFERMKLLSKEFGFRVLVTVAPSAPRVHAHDFPEMPQLSAVPHFIRYVERLAERVGFETIDLLGPLSADRSGEMLYYCDDHHWNERGNDVVARVLAPRLEASTTSISRAAETSVNPTDH